MSRPFLKAPTFLYHSSLAPGGRLFEGSEASPVAHPGDGWTDAPDPDANPPAALDDALAAGQEAAELAAQVERLTEDSASLRDQVDAAEKAFEAAERTITSLRSDLQKSVAATAAAEARADAAEAEAKGLAEQLSAAAAEIEALKAKIAPLDRDGDGKPGGSPKKTSAGL